MQFQAIWFDLDGTLADTACDLIPAIEKTVLEAGYACAPADRIRPYSAYSSRAMLACALQCGLDDPRLDTLMPIFRAHYQELCGSAPFFTGMEDVLTRIEQSGILWGVVTNKSEALARVWLERKGLLSRVAAFAGGDTTPHAKPHPSPLYYVCEKGGVAPEHCVFVGDSPLDIQAARGCAMPSVACAYGYLKKGDDPHTWGANWVIESPFALLDILHLD